MRQLLLDWGADKPQTLDNFVVGQNEELLQLLRLFSLRAANMPNERFVYLWSESGAGKSHLLQALATSPDARYIPAGANPDAFLFTNAVSLYLMDDCDR
jgi:DnaA family protein